MIKFRGIPLEDTSDIDGVDFDGMFVYGNYIKYGNGTLIVGDALQADEDGCWPSWWVPVDPKTVEQFTGLKDKYGVEIYEGDIVHGYDQEPDRDDGYIGSSVVEAVKFEEGAFWLGGIKYRILVGTPPIIETIGNIHENPELLKG